MNSREWQFQFVKFIYRLQQMPIGGLAVCCTINSRWAFKKIDADTFSITASKDYTVKNTKEYVLTIDEFIVPD